LFYHHLSEDMSI